MSFTYKYPRPAITVDAVIFTGIKTCWEVLLIQRKNNPYQNLWALPGGFLDENEDPDDAAIRELQEETSLSLQNLEPFGFWGRPGFDPRGHTISLAYWGIISRNDHDLKAADDALNLAFFPIQSLPQLAFHHNEVVSLAIKRLTEGRITAHP